MERDGFMRMYCADIRKHIEELGKKKYHELHGPGSLDFVFMFLPFEGAYLEAMDYDRDLFNIAFKNGVAMVTGSSLMPVLRMIENLWSVEKQSKNIEAIVRLAMCMYEKILKFLGSMNAVKSGLDNAQKSYEKAMDYISRGRGNVLKVVNDIRVLSGKEKTTGEIPTEYEDVDFRGHIVPLPDTQDK
jgi:DNA recombination protein RmuC